MPCDHKPEVTKIRIFDMQVCVPAEMTDEEAELFANSANPAGTTNGWAIRTEDRLLNGDPVRQPCQERTGCVHITFDC